VQVSVLFSALTESATPHDVVKSTQTQKRMATNLMAGTPLKKKIADSVSGGQAGKKFP
jgi:hypothetical protein